jgi:dGTP triphosphohydrolase
MIAIVILSLSLILIWTKIRVLIDGTSSSGFYMLVNMISVLHDFLGHPPFSEGRDTW